jgi:choice-of-anchor B domain-containing protein
MMRFFNLFTLALTILTGGALSAQVNYNMTLLSNYNYQEGCNDIWGWVDSNGVEYAILGTRAATAILSLEDPANPIERAYIPGSFSTWRDMKTWGNYAYVTCDAGNDGLLIINLEHLPDSVTWEFWKPELEVNGTSGTMLRCHNLYIDENGYAYLSGCNPLNNGGVLIFDVHSTPGKPFLVGHVEPVYSHDNFTRGDTVFSANLTAGVYITDVTDKEEHVTLAIQPTSMNFAHNVWPSDDGNYMFTTDERPNAWVDAYDISDLDNIFLTDRYRPIDTRGTGVIPHNTHYYQGYNVVSWYTDGVKVLDSHRPTNLVEVANYDTFLGEGQGFQGCWGAYPYLPSGRLLASDINTCLWVFDVDYVRAAYLEGIVINAITKEPIQGATVVIQGVQPNEGFSRPDGTFTTGSNAGGDFLVRTERSGFQTRVQSFTLTQGEVTDVTIELFPLEKTQSDGLVLDADTGLPIALAQVQLQLKEDAEVVFGAITTEQGLYTLDSIFVGEYELIAGAWGYRYTVIEPKTVLGGPIPTIFLSKGYQDDFVFDYGWTVTGNAPVGQWEWGVPEATFIGNLPSNPGTSFAGALGDKCYVTGLEAGGSVGANDLDDGVTLLLSPVMDLTEYHAPILRYHYWFVNAGGNSAPDDTLKVVLIHDGVEYVVKEYPNSTHAWVADSIHVTDYLDNWDELQIRFDASDLPGSGHIVEAGVDGFRVDDIPEEPSSTEVTPRATLSEIAPNPFAGECLLRLHNWQPDGATHYRVADSRGVIVEQGVAASSEFFLGSRWSPGLYYLQVFTRHSDEQHTLIKLK